MGQGPAVPQPQSLMALPSPAHLAHKDQRLPELGLADGTDIASFCALLPSGPDPVILFEGGGDINIALDSHWSDTLRTTARSASCSCFL